MLVLSRRETEKVIFPGLGITVEVLRVQGNSTKLGIDAPPEVPILRHEIAGLKDVEFTPGARTQNDRLRELIYAIRTRLDSTATQLNQLHTSLEGSKDHTAQSLIDGLFGELRSLETEAHRVLEDSGVTVNETPQALVEEDMADMKLTNLKG